ncbi:Saccharopine dehydrogenase-like oxidoreductase, partial [Dictyocoela roeselum]
MFDTIVYGASGITARPVIERLKKTSLTFALAGRSRERILRNIPGSHEMTIIEALPANIDSVTSQCKVLINCAGPYIYSGEQIVASCVKNSTHYFDITGETFFIEKVINKYHDMAKKKNIFIVHAAGFDSVPADLGVQYLKGQAGEDVTICSSLRLNNFCINYGTYASLVNSFANIEAMRAFRRKNLLKLKDEAKVDESIASNTSKGKSFVKSIGKIDNEEYREDGEATENIKSKSAVKIVNAEDDEEANNMSKNGSKSSVKSIGTIDRDEDKPSETIGKNRSKMAKKKDNDEATLNVSADKSVVKKLPFSETGKGIKKFLYSKETKSYWVIFMGTDISIVKKTQQSLAEKGIETPAKYLTYLDVGSFPRFITFITFFYMTFILSRFEMGRKLLLKFPNLFTLGWVKKDGPTNEEVDKSNFEFKFMAKGKVNNSNVVKKMKVYGPDPGLKTTP